MFDPVAELDVDVKELAAEDRGGWPGSARTDRLAELLGVRERFEVEVVRAVAGWDAAQAWALDGRMHQLAPVEVQEIDVVEPLLRQRLTIGSRRSRSLYSNTADAATSPWLADGGFAARCLCRCLGVAKQPAAGAALRAEDSCLAPKRTQLTLHGTVHALDAAGTRDQRQPEAQRDSCDTRQGHQGIAQREMSVRVLVACFQQRPAHFLPCAKQGERLVDLFARGHHERSVRDDGFVDWTSLQHQQLARAAHGLEAPPVGEGSRDDE